MKNISCVDLFCGAGGLTHGLIDSGIKVTAGIDMDPVCQFPFEENNHGARFIEKSVEKLSVEELEAFYLPGSIHWPYLEILSSLPVGKQRINMMG